MGGTAGLMAQAMHMERDMRMDAIAEIESGLVPAIDPVAEVDRISRFLARTVSRRLKRRGAVLGISGGVDSAVCAALATAALGKDRVFGLLMPERDVGDDGTERARRLCGCLGIRYAVEDISASLEAIGCYRRRDEAIRRMLPEYGPGWRHKIAISGTGDDRLPYFDLVADDGAGNRVSRRMPADVHLHIVAATNFKQRIRKALEYYHAERLNYAVIGTPNRLEYELGFFVRGGDGLADVKPIAHLFKTQVYGLAAYLGVPEEIRRQLPSTDTYSLPQTQEEFYFGLPYQQADVLLHALMAGIPADRAAAALGVAAEWVARVYRDLEAKRKVADRGLREAYVLDDDPAREPMP